MLSLILLLFTIANAHKPSINYRRNLAGGENTALDSYDSFTYEACMLHTVPTECSAVVSTFTMDSILNDPALISENVEEIQQWSEKVIGYYCCKLRTGRMEDLRQISFTFPQMCFNAKVRTALDFVVSKELENGFWIDLMLDYCPNLSVTEEYRHKSHFSELYSLSIESELESSEELKERVIHDCQQAESNGDDLVDLTILFPTGNGGDWQHVVAFWGDEISEESFIDWMPNMGFSTWYTLTTQSEYALLNGVAGHFQPPKKMQIKSGIRLTGLDKMAMVKKMQAIAYEATYDIMVNNCAQQVARIAEAGLRCNMRDIPFLLPSAIQVVGEEVGRTLSPEEIKVIQLAMDEFPEDSFYTSVTRRLLGFFSARRGLGCSSGKCPL